jgi:adenylate cyclase class 1
VHLESLDFSHCVMARVVFRDCRIRKVDFTLARLAGVRFEACRLEHCRFSGMAAMGLVFSGCDMTGVCLGDCEAREVRLSACALRDCDVFGARLADFQALGSRFECVNFSHAVFSRARFQGVDLTDCTIENVLFQGVEAVCCHGRGTHLSRCVFQDLKSDDPLFLAAELRSGRDRFLDRIQAEHPEPDPAFLQKDILALATRLIENWSFDMETRRRRVAVLAHNRRRLDWTMEKLGEEGTQFLRCLPGLLEAPRTWTPAGWIAAVPGTIPGHHPTFEAGRALRQIMGEACPPHAPSKSFVTISGVFSMGSLGTVAQTPSSDLDIWVCLGDDDMTLRLMDRFRKKLDGLRALAASRGMETHFFVMTEADVRENRLGLGDEEECGLARAMLLKEEFLRTALFLAGRKPAWWYVAPGTDSASYRHAVSRLARPDAPAAFEAMDMGPVDRMAGGGFFGASLWTIVKSLENPFKAVMKFALLEKYLSSGAAGTLLCDRIKRHLFTGRTGLF